MLTGLLQGRESRGFHIVRAPPPARHASAGPSACHIFVVITSDF